MSAVSAVSAVHGGILCALDSFVECSSKLL